ncbi:MAG: hypothetical protein ACKVUS_09090 [Saprospiraceae bacterium]
MADKNFFDRLKDKMAELRPSEKHRDDDWASLGERLNAALPQQPRERRRAIVLPLLLLAALLSSNAAWWQSSRSDRAALARLEAGAANLQAAVEAASGIALQVLVRTDTVWRTVYVSTAEGSRTVSDGSEPNLTTFKNLSNFRVVLPQLPENLVPKESGSGSSVHDTAAQLAPIFGKNSIAYNAPQATTHRADLLILKKNKLALLELPERKILLSQNLIPTTFKKEKPPEPFGQNLLHALRPKYFKLGGNIGWLNANSSGLMHEGGFSYGLQGQIGLSRHWCLTAAYSAGQLHYKAHDPAAILAVPVLPPLHHGFHMTTLDVTGQKTRQFDLGLRYTFLQPGKPRPYLGLGWGGLTVLPYNLEFEIQDAHIGTIQKGVFSVSHQTQLRNILRFGAGLEIPLAPRFDLILEGFYLRQWKKPSTIAPDLMGVQSGVRWLF